MSRRGVLAALGAAMLLPGCGRTAKLSLYNWGDYLARSVIDGFRSVAAPLTMYRCGPTATGVEK